MTKADAKKSVCAQLAMNLGAAFTDKKRGKPHEQLMDWMFTGIENEPDATRIYEAIDSLIEEFKRRGGIKEDRK